MECLSQCHSCLRVEYEERILFLIPFVHLLVSRNRGEGLHGARLLANTLHLLINFMDADGSGNVLNVKSIEDELFSCILNFIQRSDFFFFFLTFK